MDKKKKILLVDDDTSTRDLYANVFKNSGFEVLEASDGLEGLDKATKETPDVVFTGIIMPKMDGFQMMEAMKKNVATANIPILVSSHMGREEDRQKANVLGARYFIVREFSTPKEVVEKVEALFLGGNEYRLEINAITLDGQKLSDDLGLKNLKCPECKNQIIIKIIMGENKEEIKTALFCPSCGWQAK